jgi:radical SAM superfamily enzyme YgiQ (UPF0313 family)
MSMYSKAEQRRVAGLLEKERQTRRWEGDLKLCLGYPNTYRVGMASLGFQVVRRLFGESGFQVERTFLPERVGRKGGRVKKEDLLFSWESRSPVSRFAALAFSVSFELDYLNLVRMLLMAGIPPLAEDRHQGHSLVFAGGAAVSINPRPLARFLDLAVLGESELLIPRMVKLMRSLRGDREALLGALADEPGFYLPAYHEDVDSRRGRPPDLGGSEPAMGDIISREAEFGETVLVEVGRGCSMGCRFCWAGWACRPIRSYSVEKILSAVDELPGDFDRLGLIATSHFDHPEFMELLRGLRERGKKITLSAMRADQVNREVLEYLGESGTRSLSLAPEAGTEELRRGAGKRISDDQFIRAARLVGEAGLESLKLYFLIGMPGEREVDVAAIPMLAERMAKAAGPGVKTSLSVNIFVPKPGTPWGEEPLRGEKELRRRIRLLGRELSGFPQMEVGIMAPWEAALQTLLSRGGEEVGELLLRGAREGWSNRGLIEAAPKEMVERVVYRAG